MAKIERFEDIEAWKVARELTRNFYRVTHSGNLARDLGLREQMQRATVSIMARIAEGFDSGSNREFIKFLGYVLPSDSELQSHLYVAADQGYLNRQKVDRLFAIVTKCKNLIGGLARHLRSHPRSRTLNIEL